MEEKKEKKKTKELDFTTIGFDPLFKETAKMLLDELTSEGKNLQVDEEVNSESINFIQQDYDDLFREAAEIIVTAQQGSASLLQRKLKLGYNRCGRIIDQMETVGVVAPFDGNKARQVLITDLNSLDIHLADDQSSKISEFTITEEHLKKLIEEKLKIDDNRAESLIDNMHAGKVLYKFHNGDYVMRVKSLSEFKNLLVTIENEILGKVIKIDEGYEPSEESIKSEIESLLETDKKYFLTENGEDKFTKVEEFETEEIFLDDYKLKEYCEEQAGVSSYNKHSFENQSARLGMSIMHLSFILKYRKKENEDIFIIALNLSQWNPMGKLMKMNFLKGGKITFLFDEDSTMICDKETGYNPSGEEEILYLKADINLLSKIVNSNTVEYRVEGGNGTLSEGVFGDKHISTVMLKHKWENTEYGIKFVKDSNDLQKLIGFYRSLFDNSFGIDIGKIKSKLKDDYLTKQKSEIGILPSHTLEKLKKERLEKPEKDRIRAEEDKIKVEEETKNKDKKEKTEGEKNWAEKNPILFLIICILSFIIPFLLFS